MPKFAYKAKEGPTKIVQGEIEAETLELALQKITRLGYTPLDLSAAKINSAPQKEKTKSFFQSNYKVRFNDMVLFTRQMTDLVEASIPILRALQLVKNQNQNSQVMAMVEDMANFVKDGGSFSKALARYPKIFSNLYVELVRVGETTGNLGVVLNRLCKYLQNQQETRGKIITSLTYPFLVLMVGIMTIFVLLSFVIPKISIMFEDFDQSLPVITVILINISNFFAQFWWIMLTVVAAVVFLFLRYVQTTQGRIWRDGMVLKIPFIGQFIKNIEVARLARTLGTLTENGIPISTALTLLSSSVDNMVLRKIMQIIPQRVADGSSLSRAFNQAQIFPETVINMILVGEQTGQLDKSFYKIADVYERESDQVMKITLAVLGPAVLIVIIGIVGFAVVAMLLPILQMNLIVQ